MTQQNEHLDVRGEVIHIGDEVFLPSWRSRGFIKHPAIGKVLGFAVGDDGFDCVEIKRNPRTTLYNSRYGETKESTTFLVHQNKVAVKGMLTQPPFIECPTVFQAGHITTLDIPIALDAATIEISNKLGVPIEQVFVPYIAKLLEHRRISGKMPTMPEQAGKLKTTRRRLRLPKRLAKRIVLEVPLDEVDDMLLVAGLMAVQQYRKKNLKG